jgi:hypothetical protein
VIIAIDPAAKFKMRVDRHMSTNERAAAAYTIPTLIPFSV